MKRYLMLLAITLCQAALYSASICAGDFFERNNLAIDGYDPVAYFTEQKPVTRITRSFVLTFKTQPSNSPRRLIETYLQLIQKSSRPCTEGIAPMGWRKATKLRLIRQLLRCGRQTLPQLIVKLSVLGGSKIFPAMFRRVMRTGRISKMLSAILGQFLAAILSTTLLVWSK